MADMKAYLAEKYMSGPKADAILAHTKPEKKKKKRKANGIESSGVSLIKDDDGGWGNEITRAKVDDEDDPMDDAPAVASDRGFKKRRMDKESGWSTVKEPTPPPAADEQPMVVVEDEPQRPKGGLVTADELKKMAAAKIPKQTAPKGSSEEMAQMQETVYRDASGRKIDTKAARAEAARLKREREEKEAQKMEWGKGLVQKDEAGERRKALEKLKDKPFARHADDKEMNEDMKAKELWNDPAAAFLTKKKGKGPRKPEYNGPPPPPNRFGIKPGYRWDGVDRGNGFEKKLFQSHNTRRRQNVESYQWSVDDM